MAANEKHSKIINQHLEKELPMKESFSPSKNLLDTLNRTTLSNQKLHMQLHGSTKPDGNQITLPDPLEVLPQTMQMPMENPKKLGEMVLDALPVQNGLMKVTGSPQNTKPKHSQSDKAHLSKILARVCALQQQYGKTAGELETLVEGFCWVLSDYSMQQIIDAIALHLKKNATIPTPADIENIINPPTPKIDWPLYIELKKRLREGRVYVDQDEKQFVRNCEDLAINRQRGELENYNAAQLQLENHKTLMLED
jgi:hypothetical protein